MNTASMLTKGMAELLLKIACANLEQDGFLAPVLLLDVMEQGRRMHMLNELPNTPDQKQAYFAEIGAHYGQFGQLI